jgi:hypothetical protein
MKKLLPLALLSFGLLAHAQEGPLPTQVLITVDSKDAPKLAATDLTVNVDGKKLPLTGLYPVVPARSQIALLIDDGLRMAVGREISTLQSFVANLPVGTEVLVGYMENGTVRSSGGFTTDHAAAAAQIRLPMGVVADSASPYFCLSDFVKKWPTNGSRGGMAPHKARFVIMLTDGVDPYNGSTSILNQTSPYVESAQHDAQRAGVDVSSIYFGDAGIRGPRSDFSGQSYLSQVAEATGGQAYFEGTGNPVSTAPFLKQFQASLAETYIATFTAEGKNLVGLKVKSNVPHLKVRAATQVYLGNDSGAR